MITTTLSRIRAHGPCASGWAKLLAHLDKTGPDDEPVPFAVIVESNGLNDALWCCRAEPQHAIAWRLFAVRRARRALSRIPNPDPRSVAACDVAERHAAGLATDDELAQARRSACAAAYAAAAYAYAAAAYAYAAAAYAAYAAAYAYAAAERETQTRDFLELVS
jgi:hypothetical protein